MEYSITEFTPLTALVGGALIGLASVLMLLMTGKIAGISGIAAGLMSSDRGESAWRALFILGLLSGAFLYTLLTGGPLGVDVQSGLLGMGVSGFLVGFGTRMASGCTAGHGISGIARLSLRSVVATLTFFLTALLTVYIVRNVI